MQAGWQGLKERRALPKQEFLGTVVLVGGAMLIEARSEGLDGQLKTLYAPLSAFFIGLFIAVIILGLGGPTGGCTLPSPFSPLAALRNTRVTDC